MPPAKTDLLQKMPSPGSTPAAGTTLQVTPADGPMSRSTRPILDSLVRPAPQEEAKKPFRPFDGFFTKIKFLPSRTREEVVAPVRIEEKPAVTIKPTPARAIETVTPVRYQPASAGSPIRPELLNKIGCAADYGWITGQVQRVGSRCILHYAAPGTVDRHGGRLTLASDEDLSRFRDGDLVSTHGRLLSNPAGTVYFVTSIHLLER
jgi:hypothetical protein